MPKVRGAAQIRLGRLKLLDTALVDFCLTEPKISKIFAPAARGRLKAGGAKLPTFAYVA